MVSLQLKASELNTSVANPVKKHKAQAAHINTADTNVAGSAVIDEFVPSSSFLGPEGK